MSKRIFFKMIIGSWALGSINSLAHTDYALHILYFRSRAINHFLCNVPAMLPLACVGTSVFEYVIFVSTVLFTILTFFGIITSYGYVLFPVFDRCSKEGRKKAFNACSTHLTVVTFYYAPFIYTFLQSRNFPSFKGDKILAVFYTIFTPMLNHIYIYTSHHNHNRVPAYHSYISITQNIINNKWWDG
jgi:olfactory receptor